MNTQTATAPKAKKTLAKPAIKAAPMTKKNEAKAIVKARPQKPSIPLHALKSGYDGPSDVTNTRPTKTPINYKVFGTRPDDKMTHRDIEALAALRDGFNKAEFTRANLDAGILRRLGTRGFISHVSGSDVDPGAKFRLTAKAFTPAAKAS